MKTFVIGSLIIVALVLPNFAQATDRSGKSHVDGTSKKLIYVGWDTPDPDSALLNRHCRFLRVF